MFQYHQLLSTHCHPIVRPRPAADRRHNRNDPRINGLKKWLTTARNTIPNKRRHSTNPNTTRNAPSAPAPREYECLAIENLLVCDACTSMSVCPCFSLFTLSGSIKCRKRRKRAITIRRSKAIQKSCLAEVPAPHRDIRRPRPLSNNRSSVVVGRPNERPHDVCKCLKAAII